MNEPLRFDPDEHRIRGAMAWRAIGAKHDPNLRAAATILDPHSSDEQVRLAAGTDAKDPAWRRSGLRAAGLSGRPERIDLVRDARGLDADPDHERAEAVRAVHDAAGCGHCRCIGRLGAITRYDNWSTEDWIVDGLSPYEQALKAPAERQGATVATIAAAGAPLHADDLALLRKHGLAWHAGAGLNVLAERRGRYLTAAQHTTESKALAALPDLRHHAAGDAFSGLAHQAADTTNPALAMAALDLAPPKALDDALGHLHRTHGPGPDTIETHRILATAGQGPDTPALPERGPDQTYGDIGDDQAHRLAMSARRAILDADTALRPPAPESELNDAYRRSVPIGADRLPASPPRLALTALADRTFAHARTVANLLERGHERAGAER